MKHKTIRRNKVDSHNYASPTSKALAGMWDELIDAKRRMESEGPFLLKHLGCPKQRIFDACLGTGVDTFYLLKRGYAVVGNEIDQNFRRKAFKRAQNEGVDLRTVSYDWRELGEHPELGQFDAVLLLGNALTYLFKREDQLAALHGFIQLLIKNGILFIDVRNYEYMLGNVRAILEDGQFRYSSNYVYCGMDKVCARPVDISETRVRMEYHHLESGKRTYLDLYPFRVEELRILLIETGFGQIELFSDYRSGFNQEADFYQFVCRK